MGAPWLSGALQMLFRVFQGSPGLPRAPQDSPGLPGSLHRNRTPKRLKRTEDSRNLQGSPGLKDSAVVFRFLKSLVFLENKNLGETWRVRGSPGRPRTILESLGKCWGALEGSGELWRCLTFCYFLFLFRFLRVFRGSPGTLHGLSGPFRALFRAF